MDTNDPTSEPRGPEPSTLFAFWCEREAPIGEEVRLAIEAAFEDVQIGDDLDGVEGMLWGFPVRLGDRETEFIVWAEDRTSIPDELIDDALPDDGERQRALASTWLIGLETILDPETALAEFQLSLRLLDAACVPGMPAVYDDNALVVRSGRQVREMARGATPPRPATIYATHELEESGDLWLHTHGLTRLGLPEIELLGLDESTVREGYDLIDATVDAALGGAEPDEQHRLTVGEGLTIRVLPVDEAATVLAADVLRVREKSELGDEGHEGPRVSLLASDLDEPPKLVLRRLAEDAVVFKSSEETERQRKLARERFGVFGQLFAIRRTQGWRFHAKLGVERRGPDATREREHVWFEIRELRPGALRGVCLNAPVALPELHAGDEGWYDLETLTDWLVVCPAGNFDPEGAGVLLNET